MSMNKVSSFCSSHCNCSYVLFKMWSASVSVMLYLHILISCPCLPDHCTAQSGLLQIRVQTGDHCTLQHWWSHLLQRDIIPFMLRKNNALFLFWLLIDCWFIFHIRRIISIMLRTCYDRYLSDDANLLAKSLTEIWIN